LTNIHGTQIHTDNLSVFHECSMSVPYEKPLLGTSTIWKKYDILYWRDRATHVSPSLLDLIDWLMARDVAQRPANTKEILQR